ncbi:hypothetical protein P152DRAFT_465880 [Eremomyces bilateralis CBS 781.70]|uniref:Uncharacterized protein n=1 Tax=Eremomyces bilateralis CBS 781.70 TaxID=1392243 RepID=A0A6G1G5R5_9PEZI|nr:uncharacterized protein P152DRAFT_465880 [Eremomyces bilateralis CBS 781.70]KAF1813220.1 hypothetical protein P152DRAFT_465880 [Eremomyces bilateralis CBS 781.70]
MSRSQHDQFIDDEEEETCPLCVEEFDLSDKNFKPCPCGYQVCQFCYNNIKNAVNGLCPACRRPYDDNRIEWKSISPEELASYKADQAQQAKRKAAARQKEAQKKEAESLSRKHLAGLRVVQKNLVYVTGMTPNTREARLLDILRSNDYFGQYGEIVKIVVSKPKETIGPHANSVGVYVTYKRKEDAAKCIASVNGSRNGDRVLKAQYGTTKYCSAYLRNETCSNRNCMFLHEAGDENETFSRKDMSSMNAAHNLPEQEDAPDHPSVPQPVQPHIEHREYLMGHGEGTSDGPALPSTASWADKNQQGRRASRTTTSSGVSPMATASVPASKPTETEPAPSESHEGRSNSPETVDTTTHPPPKAKRLGKTPQQLERAAYMKLAKKVCDDLLFHFMPPPYYTQEDVEVLKCMPPMWDSMAGMRRRVLKEKLMQERAERDRQQTETDAQQPRIDRIPEESAEAGSLQLGGEPEDRSDLANQGAVQPPQGPLESIGLGSGAFNDDFGNLNLGRGLTPQQQQELLLQQFKSGSPQPPGFQTSGQTNLHAGTMPGHSRTTSRFSFANDTSTATTSVKPVANPKLMSQQASMMPQGGHFNTLSQQQQLGGPQFFPTTQGPPPGLKATGTPPVSGGGMFGQGHGFASTLGGYGSNISSRNTNDEMMRELLRNQQRGNAGGSGMPDAVKRESMFPSFLHQHPHPPASTATPVPNAPGLISLPYGSQPPGAGGSFQEAVGPQKKRKGKKHRHANTSSSGGGGGVVDVADPSILQARLHHGAAGGGAGSGSIHTGQGVYGQGSGGFPSMYNGAYGRW